MSIKLAVLKSGEQVISDAKELISEDKVCGYVFDKPHKIEIRKSLLLLEESEVFSSHKHNTDEKTPNPSGDIQIILTPWLILSNDDKIVVPPDWVVTIVDPIQTVKELYEEKLNDQNDKVSFTES